MTRERPKSNGPLLVLIAGIVVVGAGAAGWYLFDASSEPAVAEPTPAPAAPGAAPETKPAEAPPSFPEPGVRVSATPEDQVRPPSVTREYVVDGKRIRDHRSADRPPIDVAPPMPPTTGRKIPSALTHALGKKLKDVTRECVAAIPADERTGPKPKMESTITIAIADKTARIIKTSIALRDVTGPSVDAAKQCIESKALGVTEITDQDDLASYDITGSFVF